MDGLLFDSERIVQRSWKMAGDELGILHMGDVIYHTLGMNRTGRNEYFRKYIREDFPFEEFGRLTRDNFWKIVDKEGLPLKKGVKELLAYGKAQGYKMAVATSSSREYAMGNLIRAGIDPYFDSVICGDMVKKAKPDPEHPFGHGRIEYISGLVVAAAILLMAYELIRDSVGKIVHPEETEFSGLIVVILVLSILVKLYMYFYNHTIGKKLDSAAMQATAIDSLSDTCATTAVLAATLIGHFTGLHIDGWCGVLVGVFILYAGISAAKETLNPLLGQPPAEDFVMQIDRIVMSHPEICGIHDLIVHDYGPGRKMVTLHAEVPADGDILEVHDVIDNVENELREKLGCEATIHMDPIVTSDEHVSELKAAVVSITKGIDDVITIHDFRVVSGPTHSNLIFDVLVPFQFKMSDEELVAAICGRVTECLGDNYYPKIKVDHAYVK